MPAKKKEKDADGKTPQPWLSTAVRRGGGRGPREGGRGRGGDGRGEGIGVLCARGAGKPPGSTAAEGWRVEPPAGR